MAFFIILFLVFSLYSINADIIGIVGDIHCNLDAVDKVVKHMKAQGVSEIIITGDLINYKKECLDMSPSAIEKIHSKLSEVVPHEKMHVIPGNWEDPKSRGDGPTEGSSKEELLKEMNRVFKERMVSQSCSTPTIILVDGKKIRVTHEPPYDLVSSQFIDANKSPFARYNPEYPPYFPKGTVEKIPDNSIDLDIFGDTHVRTAFFTSAGVPVINPGTLIGTNKKTGSITYAIYDSKLNQISFLNPDLDDFQSLPPEEMVCTKKGTITLVNGTFDLNKPKNLKFMLKKFPSSVSHSNSCN